MSRTIKSFAVAAALTSIVDLCALGAWVGSGSLRELVGGHPIVNHGSCHDCTMDSREVFECDHQSASDACKTTECARSNVYWWECVSGAPASGQTACRTQLQDSETWRHQRIYQATGLDCSTSPGPGFTPIPNAPPVGDGCDWLPVGDTWKGRCFQTSCPTATILRNWIFTGLHKCV